MTLAPQDMVCFSLYSAVHALQQAYRPHLEKLGLTYPQFLVMSALWAAEEAPTVGLLSRQLQLESSTLTPLLKRLEGMGLVSRRRDERDERQVRISLTEQGAAMEARTAHIAGCISEQSGMSVDELLALRDQVSRLRDNLRGA
ncbi:MarR family winged helix-turn-helix transcriptional regulator [Salipiger sp. PrR002]|uniref:MarR family winged helix-turn-helix transcriptional regulator n=1 Tax=Salipiger sp. PrR002 TaxID=2706489 RepID=UPI0013B7D65E|nr:MarR family transcriptional regulator [Salipiger sp. PrR002]NDW01040.1 MarR family transcriptional regulator [Salipiger sp. PrR002]NDW58557.1 MarR family transcriptional regulator [Salipiger sp. PrR004]